MLGTLPPGLRANGRRLLVKVGGVGKAGRASKAVVQVHRSPAGYKEGVPHAICGERLEDVVGQLHRKQPRSTDVVLGAVERTAAPPTPTRRSIRGARGILGGN